MIALSRIVFASLVAASSVAAATAQAQQYSPSDSLTRTQVRADLVDWFQADYNPLQNEVDYPDNALRASAIVTQRRAERAAAGQVQPQSP